MPHNSQCKHLREDWQDLQPGRRRLGWITTVCGRCGKFIGNRPERPRKGNRKRRAG